MDRSRFDPAIDTTAFPNTPYSPDPIYWTSTTSAPDPADAWFVHFGNGGPNATPKGYGNHVRLVRGGQSFYFTLTVTRVGHGAGTVTSSPAGIDCGADCEEPYKNGTVVTLKATPVTGSTFAGWRGDVDCSDGKVTMSANKTCTATFRK